jgi:hypothetical protein
MGGQTTTSQNNSQQSQTAPWAAAQPQLQGLLANLGKAGSASFLNFASGSTIAVPTMTELPTAPQNKYAAPMPGSSKSAQSLVPSRMDGIAIKIVEMRNPIPIAMLSILFMISASPLRSLPLSTPC